MRNATFPTQTTPPHWTVEEYLAYLYLSIADADMQITDIELKTIKSRLAPLLHHYFPKVHVDIDFLLKNLRYTIQTGSEMERIKTIEELNKKFRLSKELRIDILSDLHDLINIDDQVSFSEYTMMNYIRVCFAEL